MKKQILTLAALAMIAAGAAFAGTANKSKALIPNAGPMGAPSINCTQEVNCQIGGSVPCTLEDGGPQYALNDPDLGTCSIALFRDDN